MTTPTNVALSTLIASHLASIDSTLTDDHLIVLAHLVGSTNLIVDALHLIDTQGVARLNLPNRQSLYQVSGSTKAYTVHTTPSAASIGRLGFCPCPAFAYSVLKTQQNVLASQAPHILLGCKHLLAVLICERLDTFVDKQVGLKWLAAWSSGFRTLQQVPPT
ncbi:BQ5605_C025g10053 [Microbotryum silenes-dioicae]|uniref:BQ5605_C025g10053 protein n=1 Tax=Microbotryum silenes-dioicae TaxID=796604 RepID=A0A2X0MQK2_9BASI|nr:BQ5605_C025g10053 [Microbotryum silenes-dioicae]